MDTKLKGLIAIILICSLQGCGGGSTSIDTTDSRFTLTATVSGLISGAQVVLSTESDSVTASGNGAIDFSKKLANGANYSISVSSQPTGQTCSISDASGTIASVNVKNILVNCITNPAPTYSASYSVSYSVSGLSNGQTVSVNNGIETVNSTSNANYTFNNRLTNGSSYVVSIATQPTNQFCKISNASGVISNSNISNISISCSTVYSFTGANFIYTPNLVGIVSGGTARTYNTWIRIPSPLTTYSTVLGQGSLSAYNRSALLIDLASRTPSYSNGTGTYLMQLDFQVGGVWSSRFNISDTNWHMITATFDSAAPGTGTNFYLDGVLLSNPTANPSHGFNKGSVNTLNFNNSITLGGESYDGTTLSAHTGFVGEIRNTNAWNYALTANEISDIYNSVANPSTGLFFTKN